MKTRRFLTLAAFLMFLSIGTIACSGVPQEEFDTVQADLTAAEAQIETLQSDLEAAQTEASDAATQLETLQSDLEAAQNDASEAAAQLEALQSDLETAQNEASDAVTNMETLQTDLETAQNAASDAETEVQALQDKIQSAAVAADILQLFFTIALSGEELTDEEGVTIFLDLNEKIEASGDEVLEQKFEEAILGGSGDEAMFDFFLYVIEIIAELSSEE